MVTSEWHLSRETPDMLHPTGARYRAGTQREARPFDPRKRATVKKDKKRLKEKVA